MVETTHPYHSIYGCAFPKGVHYLNNLYWLQILPSTNGSVCERNLCYDVFVSEMLLHLGCRVELIGHVLGQHARAHMAVNANELKRSKELSPELREKICVEIKGGLRHFSCCSEGSQERRGPAVQVMTLAQPSSCLVCLDEMLHNSNL